MINNNCHYEYLLKFLQKNKYDSKTLNAVSENCCNDTYCNSSFFKNDMTAVSTASVIMQKSTAASREKMTFQKLIK